MAKFKLIETGIKDLAVIEPTVFNDSRGYFMETYSKKDFEEIGLRYDFIQDNESYSRRGTLRGLHMQLKHPQGKLVRVSRGKVFDVAVDARKDSSTYGKWYSVVLSDENKRMFYVPEGFLHGFLVVSKEAQFSYKCTDFYYQGDEYGVIWNDESLKIEWPLKQVGKVVLSEKDKSLREFEIKK